ncbi:MAG: polysaccharide biosynthesis/export family protein [Alistipes onderdonkii]
MVNSKDPELAVPFNSSTSLSSVTGVASYSSATNQSRCRSARWTRTACSYMPVIGKIDCKGKTRSELAQLIADKIVEGGYINDPSVNVQFADMKISVVGEVARPGQYDVTRDKISIFDALAMAGDLTIYGIRTDVAVAREVDGVRTIEYLDLTSKDLFNSPAFYIQQNDVIYVKPNKYKAQAGEISQNRNFYLSLVGTAISVATLIMNLNQISRAMTEYNNQQQHLQNDEYENGSGLTLHDLLQMVLANWYWFALSVLIICLRRGLLLPGQHPEDIQPYGHHPRKGQPQGRRHGAGRFQRPGRFPEPPQRRQRGLHPPVAQADVGGGEAPPPDGQLFRTGRAADARPLRPLAHRGRFHRRRQPAPFAGGDRTRGRPDQAGGLRRQVPHQAGEAQGHPRPVRRHDPHPAGADGRTQDAVHGLDLRGQAHHRHQEFADGHDERLPRHRKERRWPTNRRRSSPSR